MLENFPYIVNVHIIGAEDGVKTLLAANNKLKTYGHVQAVAGMNARISAMYGLDEGICKTCGLLHDVAAVVKPGDMMAYAVKNNWYLDEAERRHPFILHQRVSKRIAEEDFGITDLRVLSAVECHTTLKAEPSAYDMALFVADKLAWDLEGAPPFLDTVEGALGRSLAAAAYAYMDYIVKHKMILYPHKWFEDGMEYLAASV